MKKLILILTFLPFWGYTQQGHLLLADYVSTAAGTNAYYQAVLDYADAQTITKPSAAVQTRQNTLCQCLDDQGAMAEFDVLVVPFDGNNATFAALNWMDPGTFDATESGTINFADAEGFSNGNKNAYLNTNWNETDGINWDRDDASIHTWSNMGGTRSGDETLIGSFNTSGYGTVIAFDGSNFVTDFQEGDQLSQAGYSVGSYYVSMDRSTSGGWEIFENGVSQGSETSTSNGETAYDFRVFMLNLDGSGSNAIDSNTEIWTYAFGGSLDGLHDEIYTCLDAYLNP